MLAGAARLASATILYTGEAWARLLGLLLSDWLGSGAFQHRVIDIKFNKVSANLRKINVMATETPQKMLSC